MGRHALQWGLAGLVGAGALGCSVGAGGEEGFEAGGPPAGPGPGVDTEDADDPGSTSGAADSDDDPSTSGADDGSTGEPQCEAQCEPGSCGDDGCGGSCGGCGDGEGCEAGTCVPWEEVVYVFDQSLDGLLRLEDLDGDGRMDGPGETVVFFDDTVAQTGLGNSQGVLALGPDEVMVTDNFDPANLVHLTDTDGDRTAFGAGEAREFFGGALAGGFAFDNPSSLHFGPEGSYYFTHNNGLDQDTISGIFSVADGNGDGFADGEAQVLVQFSEAGEFGSSVRDATFDTNGSAWVIEGVGEGPSRLMRVDLQTGAIAQWMDAADVFEATGDLVIADSASIVERLDTTGEIVLELLDLGFGAHFVAVADSNSDDVIDPATEMRVLLDFEDHAVLDGVGTPNDLAVLSDGTLIWIHALSDTVFMARDRDDDGTYETVLNVYDASEASDIQMGQPLSVHGYSGPAQ